MVNLQKVKSAVCQLNCGSEKGTAFLINENTAVTASHCGGDAVDEEKKGVSQNN